VTCAAEGLDAAGLEYPRRVPITANDCWHFGAEEVERRPKHGRTVCTDLDHQRT